MLILTLVLGILLFVIYKRRQQMSIFKRLRIPGPRPNFIFGNGIDISREGLSGVFPKWTKKFGPIVGFYVGGHPQLLITDFELIRRVLIKDFHKFSNKSQFIPGGVHPDPKLQKMLVWARDNEWRNLRASLSPSFSPHKLSAMKPLMMSSIDQLADGLDDQAKSGQEFNLKPLISELTFSTATKCIFGLNLSIKQLSNDAKGFLKATTPRLESSMLAVLMILFPSLTSIVYPVRLLWERFRFYMLWSPEGVCYDIAKKLIQTRRDAGTESVDFLQLLMNTRRAQTTTDKDLEMSSQDVRPNNNLLSKEPNSENISEAEIVSNVMLFLLASYETTSVTLQFCLHNLVNHQSIQEQLRNELRKVADKGGKTISSSALSEVRLLNHVVNETLRMFPPASPFTTRVTSEDYEYEGIVIPKGTTIFIGVSSIHNDPQFWQEPHEFRPERFEHDFDKLSFLPFGGRPRNCIGLRFAYMEMHMALAHLILKYRFDPGPSTEKKIETVETFATLIPKNGVFCKVTRIED